MTKSTAKRWETLSSKVVFEAKHWFRVVQDTVRLPSNRVVDDFFRIEARAGILIYAELSDGKVLIERQYKHGLGKVTFTFPAGYIDADETPLAAAQRELVEETGYRASDWIYLGAYALDGTRHCGTAHLFLARNLALSAEPSRDEQEELEVLFMTPDELLQAASRGDMESLPGIALLGLARNADFIHLSKKAESNP